MAFKQPATFEQTPEQAAKLQAEYEAKRKDWRNATGQPHTGGRGGKRKLDKPF